MVYISYFRLSANDIYNYKKIVELEKYKKFVKSIIQKLDEIRDICIDDWSEEDKIKYEMDKKDIENKIKEKENQLKKDYMING